MGNNICCLKKFLKIGMPNPSRSSSARISKKSPRIPKSTCWLNFTLPGVDIANNSYPPGTNLEKNSPIPKTLSFQDGLHRQRIRRHQDPGLPYHQIVQER